MKLTSYMCSPENSTAVSKNISKYNRWPFQPGGKVPTAFSPFLQQKIHCPVLLVATFRMDSAVGHQMFSAMMFDTLKRDEGAFNLPPALPNGNAA